MKYIFTHIHISYLMEYTNVDLYYTLFHIFIKILIIFKSIKFFLKHLKV